MTSKIFKVFLLFFLLFFNENVIFADGNNQIHIISRAEWGADESYRYLDSPEWKSKIEKQKKQGHIILTDLQKIKIKKEAEKVKKANNFLLNNYKNHFFVTDIIKYENGHKLVWPIVKVKKRFSIVIHDTDTNYGSGVNSYEAIRKIYRFHALTRGWGDIGYNYLIGYNGEIFRGRAGGDNVVGAHDKWNNQGAIGISLIGNYNNKPINQKQYTSLKKLIKYLVKKYDIDLSQKTTFFKWCVGTSDKCIKKPLIVLKHFPIIGHRDAGYTLCPGQKLYNQLQILKKQLNVGIKNKNNLFLNRLSIYLKKLKESRLLNLLVKIDLILDKNIDSNKRILLNQIKNVILYLENNKNNNLFYSNISNNFDDNNKIKVKLSYPFDNFINLKIYGKYKGYLLKEKSQYLLSFIKNNKLNNNKRFIMKFKLIGNLLYLNGTKILDFSRIKFFRISVPKGNIIKISSWNRKPKWDKTGRLDDNEFKGDIIIYKKNGKLIIVNELYLTDYLKGLAEVSNYTNKEKIKTIIVLARTYARWYMTKARKFAGEWFDASDNPNIFQKYLGFGYEKRSSNVSKIVEQTKNLVITYNGDLIKPWYFSQSNGKTISFLNFCKTAKGVPDCTHPEKFPFLLGILDPGGIGRKQLGHGVGVPGSGIKYFSDRGWNFEMIIKYFLRGVKIKYL